MAWSRAQTVRPGDKMDTEVQEPGLAVQDNDRLRKDITRLEAVDGGEFVTDRDRRRGVMVATEDLGYKLS